MEGNTFLPGDTSYLSQPVQVDSVFYDNTQPFVNSPFAFMAHYSYIPYFPRITNMSSTICLQIQTGNIYYSDF